jgi:hypothetical protein
MGWRDRDYARFNEAERRRFYGSGAASRHAAPGRGIFLKGAGLAIAVSFALFALGRFPPGHPLLPSLHFALPGSGHSIFGGHRTLPLNVPPVAELGSGLTIWGNVRGADGRVVAVERRVGEGGWQSAATAVISNGRFQAQLTYTSRGRTELRVRYPNGDIAAATVIVR